MRRSGRVCLVLLVFFALGTFLDVTPSSAANAEPLDVIENTVLNVAQATTDDSVDWLEPRGLSIVDLVGKVPDDYLAGSIISYTPGYGILIYESGYRLGDQVTIAAKVHPRFVVDGAWNGTMFGCLGQPARIDQPGTVSPASTVKIYDGNVDVTSRVDYYTYVPSGLNKLIRSSRQSEWQNQYRYWETGLLPSQFTSEGALGLPANMGCEVIMSYKDYQELRAVFTLYAPSIIDVEVLGTQTFSFHSYLGVGYAGLLKPLVDQLGSRFSGRHEKFTMQIPEQADYMWLDFPPMPADPYTQFPGNPTANAGRPTGGTYRMDTSIGLSVDIVSSMGLPLYGHWRDQDLSGGRTYLPYTKYATRLAAPEYFVPSGVDYHPCMIQGNCSSSVLDAIYNTEMKMTAIYLKVERSSCELTRVPLRMVRPAWSTSMSSVAILESYQPQLYSTIDRVQVLSQPSHFVYLPMVARRFCAFVPPDDPTGCPCGWMTQDGRMVDFIP